MAPANRLRRSQRERLRATEDLLATKIQTRDHFAVTPEQFWDEVFFDETYNQKLYTDALGFTGLDIQKMEGGPGEARHRVMVAEPKSEMPAVMKKIGGNSVAYAGTGPFDPKTGSWTYRVVTNKVGDKVKIGGKLWCEPKGDDGCIRIAEVEIEVKIFGVGGTIEKFIEKQTRESYEKTATFTNQWIAERA